MLSKRKELVLQPVHSCSHPTAEACYQGAGCDFHVRRILGKTIRQEKIKSSFGVTYPYFNLCCPLVCKVTEVSTVCYPVPLPRLGLRAPPTDTTSASSTAVVSLANGAFFANDDFLATVAFVATVAFFATGSSLATGASSLATDAFLAADASLTPGASSTASASSTAVASLANGTFLATGAFFATVAFVATSASLATDAFFATGSQSSSNKPSKLSSGLSLPSCSLSGLGRIHALVFPFLRDRAVLNRADDVAPTSAVAGVPRILWLTAAAAATRRCSLSIAVGMGLEML